MYLNKYLKVKYVVSKLCLDKVFLQSNLRNSLLYYAICIYFILYSSMN